MVFYLDEKYIRRRRRVLKLKIYSGLFIFFLLIGGIFYILFKTSTFKIQNITIKTEIVNLPDNLQRIALEEPNILQINSEQEQEIINDIKAVFLRSSRINYFLGGDNILIWHRGRLINDWFFQNHPQIADISIEKDFVKRSISISLKKRQKLGMWCSSAKKENGGIFTTSSLELNCNWFDQEGILFEKSPTSIGNLIYKVLDYSNRNLKLGDKVLEDKLFINLIKLFEVTSKSQFNLRTFNLEDIKLQEISALLNNNSPRILLSLKNDQSFVITALDSLKKIGLEKIDYIDLRVPDRIYYQLK